MTDDRKTDGRQTDRQTNRQTDTQTDRQTDRQTGRQTDRLTDRQADRETDRQTGERGEDGQGETDTFNKYIFVAHLVLAQRNGVRDMYTGVSIPYKL